jgi:nucleoside-diphosphate-sugar epimerase
MRLLMAEASGAIGRRLVRRLKANQHEVLALTQSSDSVPAFEGDREPAGVRQLAATTSASYRACCLPLAVSTSWATRSWFSPFGTRARNCCHDFTAPA